MKRMCAIHDIDFGMLIVVLEMQLMSVASRRPARYCLAPVGNNTTANKIGGGVIEPKQ